MKRSLFNLSHYRLFTCDMGQLIPVAVQEVLPGDTFQHSTSALVRVSPLLAPVMHPVRVRIHHWFVPFRLVWEDWEKFITGGADGMDASVYPTMIGDTLSPSGELADYMGITPGAGAAQNFSALPFRAYSLIWNEWYRDQDLQTAVPILKTSGVDATSNRSLLNCAWEKDYFTTARPWTQKGPEVTIPLGTFADVVTAGDGKPIFNVQTGTSGLKTETNANVTWAAGIQGGAQDVTWNDPKLQADLSGASASSINELRLAFALQRYEEARARYGSRYTEYLAYLGVRSPDARLQRPEYLGGGRQTIQFSEVLQTGPDTTDEGVANLKGHGIGAVRSNRYRRFFEEHGVVISLFSCLPRTMYGNSTNRLWLRRTKEDYWQRELQHIGQQEVYNGEVYGNHASQFGTFGYQDRYDEYRRQESGIAGDFRSTLDHWHYARLFASAPALNADFVKAVPTKRVNAVESEDVLWVMANHRLAARRLVAPRGTAHIY